MHNELGSELVLRIEYLLRNEKLSIARLALLSDVPASTIKDLLSGRTKSASYETIKKMASGFGMPVRKFFDDDLFE